MKGKPFSWILLGVFQGLILVAAACWFLTTHWAASPRAAEAIAAPRADARWNARVPQLQTDAPADLKRLRAGQERNLHEAARIPIEEAMRLIGSGHDYFPAAPVSPEAMRQSRATDNPAAPPAP